MQEGKEEKKIEKGRGKRRQLRRVVGESRRSRNERGEDNVDENREPEIRRNMEEENIERKKKKEGQQWREEWMSGGRKMAEARRAWKREKYGKEGRRENRKEEGKEEIVGKNHLEEAIGKRS